MPKPVKFAHVLYSTRRFDEMIAWYQKVFEATLVYQNPAIAFLTYDDEHHRFAFANLAAFNPDRAENGVRADIGVNHVVVGVHGLNRNHFELLRVVIDALLFWRRRGRRASQHRRQCVALVPGPRASACDGVCAHVLSGWRRVRSLIDRADPGPLWMACFRLNITKVCPGQSPCAVEICGPLCWWDFVTFSRSTFLSPGCTHS